MSESTHSIAISRSQEGIITKYLEILDIPFELCFTEDTVLQLSSVLQPYATSEKTSIESAPTRITFSSVPLAYNDDNLPSGHNSSSLQAKYLDETTSLFYGGFFQFTTDSSFRNITLWSPHEKSISLQREGNVTYDGCPTLLIILWGRATLSGYCFMHGALVAIDDKYILLLGDSGVGKTTLAKLFCQAGGTCLTEENPYIQASDDTIIAHSTPWPGRIGPAVKNSGQLQAIFFLHHSRRNTITPLQPKEAGRKLIHNCRPFNWLPATLPATLQILDETVNHVPCYNLGFIPDRNAVKRIMEVL